MSLNVSDAVGGTGANGEEYVTMERHQRLESALARIEEMLVASMGLGGNMGSSLPPNPTGEAAGPVRTTVGPTRAVGLTRGEVGPTATFQELLETNGCSKVSELGNKYQICAQVWHVENFREVKC